MSTPFNALPAASARPQQVPVDALEDERRRIARNLHDDIGQRLLVLKLGLVASRAHCADEAGTRAVEGLLQQVDETLQALRSLADGLRPIALDDLGLNAALDALARQSAERLGIEVTLRCDEQDPPVSPRGATALYRCVQEGLHHVARHARATDVGIELFTEAGQVQLTVLDNGGSLGLDADEPAGPGLRRLCEDIEALGGTCVAEAAPGAGTRLRVRLPVDGLAGPAAAGPAAP
jgi:two-component system sensor histidine kinase UhpB